MDSKLTANILMVDDQPGKLLSYEAILADLGENLLSATSGREALDLLLKNEIAVILMDVSMPIMDGYEATRRIRSIPELAKTSIVAVSAHAGSAWKQRALEAGCVEYVFKPVDPDRLLELVERYS